MKASLNLGHVNFNRSRKPFHAPEPLQFAFQLVDVVLPERLRAAVAGLGGLVVVQGLTGQDLAQAEGLLLHDNVT